MSDQRAYVKKLAGNPEEGTRRQNAGTEARLSFCGYSPLSPSEESALTVLAKAASKCL